MHRLRSNSGNFQTQSGSFDLALHPPDSPLSDRGRAATLSRKKGRPSFRDFIPRIKGGKPFAGLFTRLKRKSHKVKVPALNFAQTQSELLIELAYTASLLRQTIRPDNRDHLVSQLSELIRLIRGRVASAAACIQPVSYSPTSSNPGLSLSLANRSAMEKLSRFHEAYMGFVDWLNELSTAELLETSALCTEASELETAKSARAESLGEKFDPLDPNSDLSIRGQHFFTQFKNASLAVFDILKAYGFTTPMDPGQLKGLVHRSVHLSDCSPNGTIKQPVQRSAESEQTTYSVLTESDRALLAKLWSHFDAICTQTTPPPKPPLPGTTYDTPQFPTLAASSTNPSVRPVSNPVNNPEFAAYLQLLANAVQLDTPSHSHQSSLLMTDGSDSTSSRPPLPPSFVGKSSVDLNAPDRLNFPLVDASDDSDVDCAVHTSLASRWSNSMACLSSNTLPKSFAHGDSPGVPPPNQDNQPRQSNQTKFKSRPFSFESDTGIRHTTDRSSTEKRTSGGLQTKWSISHPADPADPLNDQNMQENIAIVAMRLQRAQSSSEPEPLENPLLPLSRDAGSGGSAISRCVAPVSELQTLDRLDGTEPVYYSEVKTDTEEDSELIEADGKKYRRHFQRHIMIERHKVKQVVVAPSLPDGSGPDWSRAVLTVNQSADPGIVISPCSPQHMDESSTVLNPNGARGSGAYSINFSSDLNGTQGLADETRIIRHSSSTTGAGRSIDTETGRCDTELSDEGGWDSDDPTCEVLSSTPPPPKPPPPQALMLRQGKRPLTSYMFRFGSSYYDDPERDRRLSTQLIDFFCTNWHKEESSTGPHDRSKVISYVEHYTQQTPVGEVVHRSTCVKHSCTVRMLGGLDALRARRGNSDASLDERCEFMGLSPSNLSSSSVLENKLDQLLALEMDSRSPDLPEVNVLSKSTCCKNDQDHTAHRNDTSKSLSPSSSDKHMTNLGATISSSTSASSILGLVRADEYLLWGESDNPTEVAVHAGCVDALIVYLTSFGKLIPSFFLFYETFLFIYRAFLTPEDLIERLIHRYTLFRDAKTGSDSVNSTCSTGSTSPVSSKVCISTASTLVTVVSRLKRDLTDSIQRRLAEFGELLVADNYISLNRLLTNSIQNQLDVFESHTQPPDECGNPPHMRSHSVEEMDPKNLLGSLTLSDYSKAMDNNHSDGSPSGDAAANHLTNNTATLPKIKVKSNGSASMAKTSLSARNSFVATDTDQFALSPPRPVMVNDLSSSSLRSLRRKSASPAPSSGRALSILSFGAQDLAEQLTYLEAEKYYQIPLSELLDIPNLERGKAPKVAECALHFSSVCNWTTFQMLSVAPSERDKLANRFLDVMECLHKLQNFSSYLSILCAFLLVPESLFSRKTRSRLARVKPYMQPPYFSEYRRELEAAKPPFIPYLGLMMQNLIMLAQANPLWYDEPPEKLASTYQASHGRIVNFWRCWKHFLIIHFVVKQEKIGTEKARYHIKPNPDILRFLDNFKDSMSEADLRRLANRMRREAT